MVAVGMNSIVYEVELVNTVKSMAFDFGYLDAVFCAVSPLKTGYVTASYSGHLNEIQHSSNEIIRQEPFPTVKQISCLKYVRELLEIFDNSKTNNNDSIIIEKK